MIPSCTRCTLAVGILTRVYRYNVLYTKTKYKCIIYVKKIYIIFRDSSGSSHSIRSNAVKRINVHIGYIYSNLLYTRFSEYAIVANLEQHLHITSVLYYTTRPDYHKLEKVLKLIGAYSR